MFNWHEQCLSCDVNVGSCLLSTHGWQFELARQVPIAKIFLEKKKLLRKADVYLVENWTAWKGYLSSQVVLLLSSIQGGHYQLTHNSSMTISLSCTTEKRQSSMQQQWNWHRWWLALPPKPNDTVYFIWNLDDNDGKWLITFSNGVIWYSSSNLQSHPNFGHLNCLFVSCFTSKNIEKRFLWVQRVKICFSATIICAKLPSFLSQSCTDIMHQQHLSFRSWWEHHKISFYKS